ncbi:MAG TPA: 3-oxoacyl-[acyl-carrier-protein] reductase [Firmicutes bacterium]|nr:3-oxoacyl-[acyl-carrier-protein] reductase [Bacillota bacterium]
MEELSKWLSGKVALVTGASRGIGRAIALQLAECGAAVAVNAVSKVEEAHEVARTIRGYGRESIVVPGDVREAEDCEGMVRQTVEALGGLDILVNNAGVTRDNLALTMKDDEWDYVLAVNLKGAFNCSRAALRPMLKRRWGRIVNISSIAGITGNRGQANYAASKAGLIGLTKSLAREVASRGITVNAVAPGLIDAGMGAALSTKAAEGLLQRVPMGRLGRPEEVAFAVCYLASPLAGYITGQVLVVDGGMTM